MHIEVETNNVIGALGTLAQMIMAPAIAMGLSHNGIISFRFSPEEIGNIRVEVDRHRHVLGLLLQIPNQHNLRDSEFMNEARQRTGTTKTMPDGEVIELLALARMGRE